MRTLMLRLCLASALIWLLTAPAEAAPAASYQLLRSEISSLEHHQARSTRFRVEALIGQAVENSPSSSSGYGLTGGYGLPLEGTPDDNLTVYLPMLLFGQPLLPAE